MNIGRRCSGPHFSWGLRESLFLNQGPRESFQVTCAPAIVASVIILGVNKSFSLLLSQKKSSSLQGRGNVEIVVLPYFSKLLSSFTG